MLSERYTIALVIGLTIWTLIIGTCCFFRRKRKSKLDAVISELMEIVMEDAHTEEAFARKYQGSGRSSLAEINSHDSLEVVKRLTDTGVEQTAGAKKGHRWNTALERFWNERDVAQMLEVEDALEISSEQSGSIEKTAPSVEPSSVGAEINETSLSTTERVSVEDKSQSSTEDMSPSSLSSTNSSSIAIR